jgi:hypothetical protein
MISMTNSHLNGEHASGTGAGPSTSLGGVFARHYAAQRDRRAAALAALLGAEDERPGSGAGEPPSRERPAPASRPPLPPGLPGPELAVLIWRGQLAFALSALRQWQQQMLIATTYGIALVDAAARSTDGPAAYQERAVAESRACLRRLADLSLQEARALQMEVERACDDARGAIGERQADEDGHVRRWRVKH